MTVAANTTTYNETGLAAGTTYYYRVRATNAVGDSGNTPTPVSATTVAAGTPVAIPVPDGNFDQDGAAGGGWNGQHQGWRQRDGYSRRTPDCLARRLEYSCQPEHRPQRSLRQLQILRWDLRETRALGGRFGAVYSGSMPGGTNTMGFYYPGEQETGSNGSLYNPKKAQSGADVTFTTTGISATAVAGTTYTASMYYDQLSNVSNVNACPNVTFSILANGVVVGTSGLRRRAGL